MFQWRVRSGAQVLAREHDLTPGWCVRLAHRVSDRDLAVGAELLDRWDQAAVVERGDAWRLIRDRTQGAERPVISDHVSGRLVEAGSESLTALFRGGFYLSPMAGSCSLSWPFSLT